MFSVDSRTLRNWLSKYEETGDLERKNEEDGEERRKFKATHREWICTLVNKQPLLFAHEIAEKFCQKFYTKIAESSVCRILRENGYCKKVVERRALQIRDADIFRFVTELHELRPLYHQLLFLDEVSTDSRKMLRRRGWFLRGSYPFLVDVFKRGKRISMLAFLGQKGLLDIFDTDGTFDRQAYFRCIRRLIADGKIEAYPGKHSVWIIDGASIHLDSEISTYLRSMGTFVIYLPAYAPFFNVIEYMFGDMKREWKRLFDGDEVFTVIQVANSFLDRDFSKTFFHCGYNTDGSFDFLRNLHEKNDLNLKSQKA